MCKVNFSMLIIFTRMAFEEWWNYMYMYHTVLKYNNDHSLAQSTLHCMYIYMYMYMYMYNVHVHGYICNTCTGVCVDVDMPVRVCYAFKTAVLHDYWP